MLTKQTSSNKQVREIRENPDVPEDSFGIEYLGKMGLFERCNIHWTHFSLLNVPVTKDHKKYSLLDETSKSGAKWWIEESKIDEFINKGWRPPKKERKKIQKTNAVYQDAPTKSTYCRKVSNRCFVNFVGYITRWFTRPSFRDMSITPATGMMDLHALTTILISAKTLSQFVAEANAFIPAGPCKLLPEFDPSYLDLEKGDPDKPEDTISEIKLRQWYTEMRAMCKAELTSLQFKYGTISKNSYAWLLERCFSKEFSLREQSKKSTNVTVKNEVSKPKTSNDEDEEDKQTEKAVIELCFSEEPG